MRKSLQIVGVLLVAMLVFSIATKLRAQTDDSGSGSAKSAENVPQAALLTERGRQLAEQLRLLKRSRDSMGSKHPSLPSINTQIEAIEEQLEAWEPAFGEPAENPFHPGRATPQMNEFDLRQIVIRLNKRVESLEKRVAELERR
jgi:uncharacterized protein involved in exopolysaccharide biosynthesis